MTTVYEDFGKKVPMKALETMREDVRKAVKGLLKKSEFEYIEKGQLAPLFRKVAETWAETDAKNAGSAA